MKNRVTLMVLAFVFALLSIALGNQAKKGAEEKNVYLINRSKYGYEQMAILAGAKSAADEYGINLQILAPDYEKDVRSQKLLLEEALSSKADGIIVYPIDSIKMVDELNEVKNNNKKLVIINENAGMPSNLEYIGPDYEELARQIVNDFSKDIKNVDIYVSKDAFVESYNIMRTIEKEIGDEVKFKAYLNSSSESQVYPIVVKENLKNEERTPDVIICLDEKSLLGLAKCKEFLGETRVIGVNMSLEIAKNIDNGNIDKVYAVNNYAYAYRALSEIIGKKTKEMDYYYIVNKDNLFDKNIEKIIFPIE